MKLRSDQKQRLHALRDKIEPWHVTESTEVFNALLKVRGDKTLAAFLLGVGKTTVYRKIDAYRLRRRIEKTVANFS